MNWPILSVTTFLPLVGALFIMLVKGEERLAKGTARWVALWTTLVTLAVSLVMVWRFDPTVAEFQFVERYPWLGFASYHMGVGAELWIDLVLGYYASANLRLGVAKGLDDEAPSGFQTYFVASSAF